MRPIQRIISAGFATAALASASIPAVTLGEWSDNAGPGLPSASAQLDTHSASDIVLAMLPEPIRR
jgi:hypothetical protein